MLKRLGTRIFRLFCHSDFQEDILGDLDEYYQQNLEKKGRHYAGFKFFIDVLLLFRLSLLRDKWSGQNSNYLAMFHTIFKTAFRVFWRERVYALINVLGLTVGLSASALLLLYVESERSVNGFHRNLDQTYQVLKHQRYSGDIQTSESIPGPLNTTFKDDFPEVEAIASYTWTFRPLFMKDDHRHQATGRWASDDFFKIFTVNFIEGSAKNALTSPSQLYISESTRERLFGQNLALTETVEVNGLGSFQIAGVFEDVPAGSTIDFDFIMPYRVWKEENDWVNDWDNSGPRAIAKLQAGVDVDQFNAKIEGYVQEKMGEQETRTSIFVQPLKDRYLYNKYEEGKLTGGRIVYIHLFTAIAIFIVLIASINFMNLATARSTKRAKEVGIKKVVGSSRGLLLLQFMTESVILSFFSAILAGLIVMWVIDPINLLVGKQMTFSLLQPDKSLALLAMGLILGIISGLYPSVVLSNFKVLSVLKGNFRKPKGSIGLRKGLVVFQFMISTVLIIATLVVQKQLDFINSKDLGFTKENMVLVPVQGQLNDENVRAQLKSRLLANPDFTHVAFSSESTLIDSETSTAGGFSWAEKEDELETNFNLLFTEHGFLDAYDIELLAGRSFDPALATDSMHVLINEQTAKLMNVADPLNHTVNFWGRTGQVIGIIKNFHFSSLHSGIEPLVISLRPGYSQVLNVRITGQNNQESIAYLENILKEFNPDYPFSYSFLSENYEAQYRSELIIGTLGDYFSGIVIFISLLGLFGLASFSAEQRIKEIGIRKVLGAGVFNLMLITTQGYLLLVSIGFVVAAPVAYFFMNQWLEAFTYSIDIGLSIFLIAGLASLLITLTTISYHAIKAAYANPVNSLKYE